MYWAYSHIGNSTCQGLISRGESDQCREDLLPGPALSHEDLPVEVLDFSTAMSFCQRKRQPSRQKPDQPF